MTDQHDPYGPGNGPSFHPQPGPFTPPPTGPGGYPPPTQQHTPGGPGGYPPAGPGGQLDAWAGNQPYGGPHPYGPPAPYGPMPVIVQPAVPPKSVGVALLLTFLWLGAGHLYAGRTTAGVLLLIADLFLWMLSFFIITLILTVPVWLILWVIAMVTSASAVTEHNARLGYRV
ncbi:hypothetical protein [Frankia sp. AgB32]|uniref:hypothetical protein n=1 Tax=Frankia sp. AgB32 TaxID=631119 RepID=UPI00200DF9EB|nr:hypothetical protein [Frankia sp. AgB32]MCK9897976.1 hypothetical protein [Frankia sp. AgB32]